MKTPYMPPPLRNPKWANQHPYGCGCQMKVMR